ncbi:hypothetical protein PIB30_075635 [Stylosanthes scabra]|uniref:Uncharacterized protein n=1 Tax=Stylosanthes scabra TaxID=79078 RepID=A0ABU6RR78_9FABA|nr:hypothetical protein [Stylosanthes scabra]
MGVPWAPFYDRESAIARSREVDPVDPLIHFMTHITSSYISKGPFPEFIHYIQRGKLVIRIDSEEWSRFEILRIDSLQNFQTKFVSVQFRIDSDTLQSRLVTLRNICFAPVSLRIDSGGVRIDSEA